MSIIERAMTRQRARGAASVPAKSDAESGRASNAAGLAGLAGPPQLTPDPNQLEMAGLLPPAALRNRHIHEYRVIKRTLLDTSSRPGGEKPGCPSNLVMVTSALAAEGKTYTSFNLARSLALELDRQIVLVDADIPKRDLSRALGADAAPGLLDLLRDERLNPEDVLLSTSMGFRFLPVGKADERANELISSQRMVQVATLLGGAQSRNTVLLDSPPMLLTSEAPSLARLVGQIVVVVRAFVTPQDAVREVISRIDPAKRISAILNGWTPSGALDKQYQLGYYYGDGAAAAREPK